jgi:NADH-quinone oxidoreductase subunit L
MDSNAAFAGLPLLAWIPLLPLLGAFLNLTLGRRWSKATAHTIAILSVAGACGLAIFLVFSPQGLFQLVTYNYDTGAAARVWKLGGIEQTVYTWIEVGSFKTQLAFRLDTLSAVMILIITFVGSLIHIYSTGYMAAEKPGGYARYFGYLNLFTGSMLILVLAANMPVMFIGWEGVGLCSFLLIGFWFENDAYATAGRKAFVVNRIGDFAFLLGMFLLYWAVKGVNPSDLVVGAQAKLNHIVPGSGTGLAGQLPEIITNRGSLDFANLNNPALRDIYTSSQSFIGGDRLAAAAGILLFIGACGKSAQIPLYVWLPDAMAGPTPVSALIHAATMVTAGVYMVCRLSLLYSSSTTAMGVVCTVGLLTALAAAFMAFAQTDLKKVLAYSTVSQLGFMFVAAGTGNWVAAIFHLGTHAFFKACLFLGAGSVMHGMEHGGSTTPGDITTMGGLRKHMPFTHGTFLVSCLAIAGIFPFSGFFSKDEILAGAWGIHAPGWPVWYGKVLWVGLLLAALGTAFYMWRLYFMVFAGRERSEPAKHAHESPATMTAPLVILATLAALAGIIGLPHLHSSHEPSEAAIAACSNGDIDMECTYKDGANDVAGSCTPGEKGLACTHDPIPTPFHALSTWLAPTVSHEFQMPGAPIGSHPIEAETANATTYELMGLALLIGLVGIGLAYMFYGRGPSPSVEKLTDGPLHGAYEASKNKLWVDEAYDRAFVRPFRATARGLFEIVDRFIIDTIAVNGAAFVVGLFGRVSRWFQNGQVQRYLAGVVVGGALMFLITDCHQKPDFTYKLSADGRMLELHAQPGAGVIGERTILHWHVDGNTDCEFDKNRPSDPKDLVDIPAGNATSGTVVLCIVDPMTHKATPLKHELREEN